MRRTQQEEKGPLPNMTQGASCLDSHNLSTKLGYKQNVSSVSMENIYLVLLYSAGFIETCAHILLGPPWEQLLGFYHFFLAKTYQALSRGRHWKKQVKQRP